MFSDVVLSYAVFFCSGVTFPPEEGGREDNVEDKDKEQDQHWAKANTK
jgi:hypothetical protein